MKKNLLLFLILILFQSISYSQNTFEKIYENYNMTFGSVFEIDNFYYFFDPGNLVKTDVHGEVIEFKHIGEFTGTNSKPQVCYDGANFLIPSNFTNNGYTNSLITRVNKSGEIIDYRIIATGDFNETVYSTVYANGTYFVLTKHENDSLKVYSFRDNLELNWIKASPISLSFSNYFGLTKTDNSIIAWGRKVIDIYDYAGNKLQAIAATSNLRSLFYSSAKIYVDYGTTMDILSEDGSLIKNISLGGLVTNFYVDDNENIIALNKGIIKKIDSSGNIIWSGTHRGNSEYFDIIPGSDNSYIVCGSADKNGWALKIREDGQYEVLDITSVERLPFNKGVRINFYLNTLGENKLSYSMDKNDWTLITTLVSTTTSYSWVPPLVPDDQTIYVKIESTTNSENYDIHQFSLNTTNNQVYDYVAANEVAMWVGNNGDGSHDPITDKSGFYWPGAIDPSGSAIFRDGLLWGGKIDGKVYFNGNAYRQGVKPGKILSDGTPDDPSKPIYNIFKLKRGWESLPDGPDKDRYEYNFKNWPMELGASYNDVNGDGEYTPGIDGVKYLGDETLFYVCNDLDSATTKYTYGSDPIGLEIQTTVWAFDSDQSPYKDAVYKLYRIINKSDKTIEDMYLSYWTDDDLGDGGDDFVGVVPEEKLGYTYNGDEDDLAYGTAPPAVGHMFVQTPIEEAASSDSGFFKGKWRKGIKNTPMTSFSFYINPDQVYRDPTMGEYSGSLEFYNYQQGLTWDGSPYVNPNTLDETKFPLSGEPWAGTGWYEGDGWPGGPAPDDRRFLITTGKFNMAPNDTQEVAVAIYMARESNSVTSARRLISDAPLIQSFYYDGVLTDIRETRDIVKDYNLYQNYPNPFNPETTIKFSVVRKEKVNITLFNAIGEQVAVLTNKEFKPGVYEMKFNGKNLSSGIYFYRMNAGSYSQTRKMILLK